MSDQGAGGVDETETYDRSHGTRTLADEQRLANIKEGSNKEPPQYVPYKITQSK